MPRSVRYLASAFYLAAAVAVTVAGLNSSHFFSPAVLAALILAPAGVLSAPVVAGAVGLPWLAGLTQADPDNYEDRFVYPVACALAAANALAYVWIFRRYWRRRHLASATTDSSSVRSPQ